MPPAKRAALSGWGRYPSSESDIFRPEKLAELAAIVSSNATSLIARGAGRAYGDAALNHDHRVVDVQRLNRMLAFDPDSGQGTKGVYNAYFVPTVPGDYTFHFSGTIHTTKVNITVKSSPTTFDSAHDPAAIQFPQQAPSNLQLAQRLDAQAVRQAAAVQAADSKASSASTALAVGIAGLVVGAAGLCVGGIALARGRSRSQSAAAGSQHPARVE